MFSQRLRIPLPILVCSLSYYDYLFAKTVILMLADRTEQKVRETSKFLIIHRKIRTRKLHSLAMARNAVLQYFYHVKEIHTRTDTKTLLNMYSFRGANTKKHTFLEKRNIELFSYVNLFLPMSVFFPQSIFYGKHRKIFRTHAYEDLNTEFHTQDLAITFL